MGFAQTELYCTANDHVNHSCGILIDKSTSGAPSGRIREPRQLILHVRRFRVETSSPPVEFGALLALSRGQRLLSRDELCFQREPRGKLEWGRDLLRK